MPVLLTKGLAVFSAKTQISRPTCMKSGKILLFLSLPNETFCMAKDFLLFKVTRFICICFSPGIELVYVMILKK